MNSDLKEIPVSVGDVVEFVFGHRARATRANAKPVNVTGRITDVIPRYEHCNDGQTKVSDLVEFKDLSTGEVDTCDVGYVSNVLSRGVPRVLPKNIYRDAEHTNFHGLPASGEITTYWRDAIIAALSEMDVKATTPLKDSAMDVIETAWGVQKFEEYGIITLNVKSFRRWMKKNWSRLLCTTKETDARRTKYNQEMEKSYWDSVDDDMAREYADDLKKLAEDPRLRSKQ